MAAPTPFVEALLELVENWDRHQGPAYHCYYDQGRWWFGYNSPGIDEEDEWWIDVTGTLVDPAVGPRRPELRLPT